MAFYRLFISFCLLFHYIHCSAELITSLPGQPPNIAFKQHSGYIVTDVEHGRALFCYFVEAESTDPVSLPLTLWLNGGSGCSSLGFGAFMEHGPFQPGENGLLYKNKYSWNLKSNMLYVESPIGVGFSYSNTSSDYNLWNDTMTAEDNLRFVVNWLEEFPQYKESDLFLTGESYAGHYIPQLAMKIVEYNKQPNIRPIKLKSIALGNPLLDLEISVLSEQYLWSHGAISDDTLMLKQKLCNDSRFLHEYVHKNISQECSHVFKLACRPLVYQIENFEINIIPLIAKLVTQGIPILLYSGDQDTKIPVTQTRTIANNLANELKLVPITTYAPWYSKNQVGGWSQSFGNKNNEKYLMAFASVRGGGHEVPFTSPSQALTLFTSFLLGSPLPRPNFSKPNNLAHQLNW